jgi:hypothetical protein
MRYRMNFEEALKALKDGEQIKRKDWLGYLSYDYSRDLLSYIDEFKNKMDIIAFKKLDILSNDWEVVNQVFTARIGKDGKPVNPREALKKDMESS